MFTKAESFIDLVHFNMIFKQSFAEKKYETEEFPGFSHKFLVDNKFYKESGTVEFVPYNPANGYSTIEDLFDFSSLDFVKETSRNRIFEIDKLSVLESERKNGVLENIMKTIIAFAKENNVKYYLALINPILFKAIRVNFHFPIEKCGKMVRTKDYLIQPMVIDMEKVLYNYKSWDKDGFMEDWIEEIEKQKSR